MKFGMEVVLEVGKVRNTVLRSYHSSRGCMARKKYGAKLKMAVHTVAKSCFVVDAQPLLYIFY